MRALLLLAVLVVACTREAPPTAPVVIERPVYVYVPERSGPPVQPGPGIGESPIVAIAREERMALEARRDAAEAAAREREPEVVYAPSPVYDRTPYLSTPYYVPTPQTVVIVKDLPASERKHTPWHYDRAVARCDQRPTKWARERCYRREAR